MPPPTSGLRQVLEQLLQPFDQPVALGQQQVHFVAQLGNLGRWARIGAPRYVALALAAVFKDIPPWTPPLFYSWSHKEQTYSSSMAMTLI
jgi:hypothetical protein